MINRILIISKLAFILILLNSCKSLIIENNLIKKSDFTEESRPNKNSRIEIKFSCGEEGLNKYLDDGWIIVEEYSEEKICTWKSLPAQKGCDMEKDKGCKVTKPDKIGEEILYILERN